MSEDINSKVEAAKKQYFEGKAIIAEADERASMLQDEIALKKALEKVRAISEEIEKTKEKPAALSEERHTISTPSREEGLKRLDELTLKKFHLRELPEEAEKIAQTIEDLSAALGVEVPKDRKVHPQDIGLMKSGLEDRNSHLENADMLKDLPEYAQDERNDAQNSENRALEVLKKINPEAYKLRMEEKENVEKGMSAQDAQAIRREALKEFYNKDSR